MKDNIYFIGAGGIGMANLERYFLAKGKHVGGYDLTESALTRELASEGVEISYADNPETIPPIFKNRDTTLVVYTPAVPDSNSILKWFRTEGFEVIKRAALLGKITRSSKGICVAGSHGKTTVCSMTANILRLSQVGCNAFLGGILRNTGSNLVLSEDSEYSVIEADEYDRSFHHLSPWTAIITSTDADHLDIYGTAENYVGAFEHFTSLIKPGGNLLLHSGLAMRPRVGEQVKVWRYGAREGDFHADNIVYGEGTLSFDFIAPDLAIRGIELGVPVEINIDNAVAAAAASHLAGASADTIKEGLATFMGAKRRFEIYLRPGEGRAVLIDDYAHSPNEIKASIASVRKLFPGKKISVVFQPHLYSRTRDFAREFGETLSEADRVWLPEIYPARELPIPGVSSQLIADAIHGTEKKIIERKNLLEMIKNTNFDILMTLGAADLDRLLPQIATLLKAKL